MSNIISVVSCADSGPNTLRQALSEAVDGTVIDFNLAPCNEITLRTGELLISVNNVTLQGPVAGMTIDGSKNGRVIRHIGIGKLDLENMTIRNGDSTGSASPNGGCIYSTGHIFLDKSIVTGCQAKTLDSRRAYGGAIFVEPGGVALYRSTVSESSVYSATGKARGGGIAASYVTVSFSTISGNSAYGRPGNANYARGGGIYASNLNHTGTAVSVSYSTISNNKSEEGGGVFSPGINISQSTISSNKSTGSGGGVFSSVSGSTVNCRESTISGNNSGYLAGGMLVNSGNVAHFSHCTVTNNHAVVTGGGLYLDGNSHEFIDTLVAGNFLTSGAASKDIGGGPQKTMFGSNNLIVSSSIDVPQGTIRDAPMLAALADNGGLTMTHALLPGSAAIDHGASNVDSFDQRGAGFRRVVGAAPDIGAFEFNDVVFASGFE
ncbi:MAG: choice-of-anchor Q domain-containing protein [Rudaea sp.]